MPNIIKLGNISKNIGVLFGGDHIVLSLKVDLSTITLPIGASNIFLTIAVVLFAVSTMISWSYYGLQSWKFLFGRGKAADLAYKLLFLLFVIIGAAASMGSIWQFSDAMIFAMIFPNMVGLFFLFPVVKKQLNRYLDAIKASKK
jgi:AGCS family alanine or glycine:cation symporter